MQDTNQVIKYKYWTSDRLPTRIDSIMNKSRSTQCCQTSQLIKQIRQLCTVLKSTLKPQPKPKLADEAIVDRLDRLIDINCSINEALSNAFMGNLSTSSRKKSPKERTESGQIRRLHSLQTDSCNPFTESRINPEEKPVNDFTSMPDRQTQSVFCIVPEQYYQSPQSIRCLTQKPLRQLVKKLKGDMGKFFSQMTDRLYKDYTAGRLTYRDLKIEFSQEILNHHATIQQQLMAEPNLNQQQKVQVTTELDKAARNVLEFLMSKYPPSRNKIIDTELSTIIKSVQKHMHPVYDILSNAQVKFHEDDHKNFTYDIKIWINKIISQTKQQFPIFKQTVKSIFSGRQNSSCLQEAQSQNFQYEIGSKIKLTTQLYSDDELRQPRLNLKSPELLRILIKWVNDLYSNFTQPQKRMSDNGFDFKSTIPGVTITLSRKRREELIRILKEINIEVQEHRIQQEKETHRLINDVFILVKEGFKENEELNAREVTNVKTSQYLREYAETYCLNMLQKLLMALKSVRSKYRDGSQEANMDLVTFGVMDLLRCRCVGSKKQIRRIYQELENHDMFEIIRVKDKLNESTRDILINFQIKNSFLICEMQLALGDSKDQLNDHFCHNLYELHRSNFPILLQVSNRMVNLDYRMSYFDSRHPIEFKVSKTLQDLSSGIKKVKNKSKLICNLVHPESELVAHKNITPFCCSHCSLFINAFSTCLDFLRCSWCMVSICPRCIMELYPEIRKDYFEQYVYKANIRDFIETEPEYWGFCTNKELEGLIKKTLEKAQFVHVFQFDNEGSKIWTVKKVDGITPAFYTLDLITTKRIYDSPMNLNLLFLPKRSKQTILIDLEELNYYRKLTIDQNRSWPDLQTTIHNLKIQKVVATLDRQAKTALIIDIYESQQQIKLKKTETFIIKHVQNQSLKADAVIELTGSKLKDLSVLEHMRDKSALKNLNVWQNNLTQVQYLRQFTRLQDLNLGENQLTSLEGICQLQELQSLNLSSNKLTTLPVLKLPVLKFLDVSSNQLKSIDDLTQSSLPTLKVFILSRNQIRNLPFFDLPELEILKFNKNKIESLGTLAQSNLAKLRRLIGNNNEIQGELPQLNMPALEELLLKMNKINNIDKFKDSGLRSLYLLDISRNQLTGSLPRLNLPQLRKLFLQSNKIQSISEISSSELQNLINLNLSNNEIVGQLPRLSLSKLRLINLNNNRLDCINSLQSSNLESLQSFSASLNNITCLPLLKLRQLKVLRLAENKIQDCKNLEKCKLPSIQVIDLANNGIQSEMPVLFFDLLEQLCTEGNPIQKYNFMDHLQLLPKLSIRRSLPLEEEEVESPSKKDGSVIGNLKYLK